MSTRYAILIGIDKYERDISALQCAESDTRDLAAHLQNVLDYEANAVHVFTTDSQGPHYPTKDNILAALAEVARKANPDDTVLFHFSGHGVHFDGHSYLLPVDATPDSRGLLAGTSLSSADLKLHFSDMACSGIACILDCCRNDPFGRATILKREDGSFGRDILAGMKAAAEERLEGQPKPQVGILHSCSPTERAWEWEAQRHGFFTHYLLESLRVLGQCEESLSIARVADYIAPRVSKQVRHIHDCSQVPFAEGQHVIIGNCRAGARHWASRWAECGSSQGSPEPEAADETPASVDSGRPVEEAQLGPDIFAPAANADVYDIQLIPSVQDDLMQRGHLCEILVESNAGNRNFLFFAQGEPVFLLHKRPTENASGVYSDARVVLADPTKELGLVCVESDQGYLKAIGLERVSVQRMAERSSGRLVYADFILYEAGAYHSYAGTRFPHELFENVETPEERVLKSSTARRILDNFELFRKVEEARIFDSAVRLAYTDVWVDRPSDQDEQLQCNAHFVVGEVQDGISFDEDEQLCLKHVTTGAAVASVDRAPGIPVGRFVGLDRHRGIVTVSLYAHVGIDTLKDHNLLVTDVGGSLVALRRQRDALVKLQRGRAVSPAIAGFVFDVTKVRSPDDEELKKAQASLQLSTSRFDESQIEAIVKSLAAPDIALIQGPPGTGKTTVICEIIRQTLLTVPDAKVLVSSQSNMAADNVLGRLGRDPLVRAVRVGREETVTLEGKGYIAPNATRSWLHAVRTAADQNRTAVEFAVGLAEGIIGFRKAVADARQSSYNVAELDREIEETKAYLCNTVKDIQRCESDIAELRQAREGLRGVSLGPDADLSNNARRLLCLVSQRWIDVVGSSFASDSKRQAGNIEASLLEWERLRYEHERLGEDIRSLTEIEMMVGKMLTTRGLDAIERRAATMAQSAAQSRRFMTPGSIGVKFHDEVAVKVERVRRITSIPFVSWIQKWIRGYALTIAVARMTAAKEVVNIWIEETWTSYGAAESNLLNSARNYTGRAREQCQQAIDAHLTLMDDFEEKRITSESQLKRLKIARESAASILDESIDSLEHVLPLLADSADSLQRPPEGLQAVLRLIPDTKTPTDLADALASIYKSTVGVPRQHAQGQEAFDSLTAIISLLDRKAGEFVTAINSLASKLLPHSTQWGDILDEILMRDEIETSIISQYTDRVNLVAGTCIGLAGDREFQATEYDLVVIDEAGRATPLELLVPMLQGRRFVLVGDHRQLPPHIDDNTLASFREKLRDSGESLGSDTCPYFEHSFFHEFFEGCPETATTTLTYQYRMHPQIREIVGSMFYGDVQLREADADLLRRENEHPFKDRLLAGRAALWLDTRGIRQSTARDGAGSMFNTTEADLVAKLLLKMSSILSKGQVSSPAEVGVITFYSAQKRALVKAIRGLGPKLKRFLEVEVDTVDAFQGREKQAIVVSTVVANASGQVSRFVASPNRVNVALSRAKQLLVVIGNSRTLTQGRGYGKELFGNLLALLEDQAAWEDYPYDER